jgi:hypothetical protein
MTTQSGTLSKSDQKTDASEPGASQIIEVAIPSRTRSWFLQFEIGVKKTTKYPGRTVGLQPQQEAPVAQSVLAFPAGAPKPPAPALDGAAPVLGLLPGASSGSGSPPSTTAAYIQLSVGETVTPPNPGGGDL